jgi:hypothetical protein
MKYILFSLVLFTSLFSISQEDYWESQNVKKHFLIVASTKSYESALKTAREMTTKLDLKFDDRDLKPHEESGLTWSNGDCEENGWEYPCYVARGRHDDGEYVSIEWSNAIKGFTKGYYVVIVSSQSERDEAMKSFLKRVKEIKPSAYIKSAEVYIGCMH